MRRSSVRRGWYTMIVRRSLVLLLAVNVLLSLGLLGWVTWIVAEPRYWFESAYLQQGPSGDKGPRGEPGPIGPPGPVGPDAADAYVDVDSRLSTVESTADDLDSRLTDLDSRLTELDSRLEELESQSNDRNNSSLETSGDDAEASLAEICQAVNLNYIYASNSAIEELLADLNNACA